MIFRYSIPTFSVCAPFVQVTESLMMNVGPRGDVADVDARVVAKLREPVAERHLRRHVVAGHAGNLREVVDEVLVDRAVSFVAVQVPHRHVVQQRAGECPIPVEAADPRVLRIGVGLVGDRLRQHRHELGRRALVPHAHEDVVVAPDLQVEPAHVVVGVAEDRVGDRRPEVVVQRPAARRMSAAPPATAASAG